MFEGIRRWVAVRSYAKSLGPKLKERYGENKHYTPAQVKRTAEECGYNTDYLCMALCMYCTYPDFTAYHQSVGETCDYNAMRVEVADRFFGGDASFDAVDVIHGGSGWDAVDAPGHHDGGVSGGDSGGCFGGDSGTGGGGD
jgi:hypothetical protein